MEKKTKVVSKPKKVVAKKPVEAVVATVPVARKHGDVNLAVFGADGKEAGSMSLPISVFAAKINKPLMAQAVRVYLANQREGSAATKTRSEVDGSTRKLYKQKGTGRARHGSLRAPIFVKGGVALGPKPRDYSLDLPKKMKKQAVASALTSKLVDNAITVVSEFGSLEPKTRVFAELFETLGLTRKALVLLSKEERSVVRGMRNLPYVCAINAVDAYTHAVLSHRHIVMTKKAVKELEALYD